MIASLAFRVRYWADKRTCQFQMWAAWRLPNWLVRWAVVRAYATATTVCGDRTPDELTYREVYDGAEAC